MNIILFGGSGYIGSALIRHYLNVKDISRIFVFDIKECTITDPKITYRHIDVREKIEVDIVPPENSIVYNLAAVHREPGHQPNEYFDTNIKGAENVCAFAESIGCSTIVFTSSIAVYGRSKDCRNEDSPLYPETPYGISKLVAEKIHEIWLNKSNDLRLIICRPSVIFGPKDPGNIYRMIRAIQKGYFVFPGSSEIKKSFGYIYGLIDSFEFVLNKNDKLIIYNYAETPVINMSELASIIKIQLKCRVIIFHVPLCCVILAAKILRFFKPNSSIHPVRVRKAAFPTNIEPQYLIKNNFPFKYPMAEALAHWKNMSPEDFQ